MKPSKELLTIKNCPAYLLQASLETSTNNWFITLSGQLSLAFLISSLPVHLLWCMGWSFVPGRCPLFPHSMVFRVHFLSSCPSLHHMCAEHSRTAMFVIWRCLVCHLPCSPLPGDSGGVPNHLEAATQPEDSRLHSKEETS